MTFQSECSESVVTQMDQFLPFTCSKTARKTGHIHLTTHTHTHPPSTRTPSTQKRFADKKRTIYVAGGRFSTAVARILALNLQLLRPNVMLLDDLDQKDKGCLLDMNRRSVFMVFDFARYQKKYHQSRPCSQAERRDHSSDLRRRTVTDQDGRVHSPSHIHRQLPAIERHGNSDSNHGNPAQRRLHTDRFIRERTPHRMGAADRRGDRGVDASGKSHTIHLDTQQRK